MNVDGKPKAKWKIQAGGENMFMLSFIIVLTLFWARSIAGYDSRYNARKYFTVKRELIAWLFLPKSVGLSRQYTRRSKADYYKMTYIGAVFYLCNLLIILSIPVFLILIPEIPSSPFEIDSKYVFVFADTINEKIPVISALILLAAEILCDFINIFSVSKRENKKLMTGLVCVLMGIIFIWLLLLAKELLYCFVS